MGRGVAPRPIFVCASAKLRFMGLKAVLLIAALMSSGLDARKDIERQYGAWVKAALALDADKVGEILTPDYELVTYTEKVIARDAYLQGIRDRKAKGEKPDRYVQKIKAFAVDGDMAVVESHETSDLWLENPETKKKDKFRHTHVYEDTWVRTEGKWKLKRTVTRDEVTEPVRRAPLSI